MSIPPTNHMDNPLPTIHDHPTADVVIFDGKCPFCRRQVTRLHRWDGASRLAFISLHDPEVARRFPNFSTEQLLREMVVVTRSGQWFGGADAFRYLSRRLPKLWALAPWLHLPGTRPIQRWVYQWIATRRYRISGGAACDESCEVRG